MASKVTSKLQVTIPKTIADRYDIVPGQEIEWLQAGDAIRVVPQRAPKRARDRRSRLALFDQATARQLARQSARPVSAARDDDRGWTREDLYERGHTG
jgi:bifunctional DNA-binding transcriptional regulator/antitoxin component of YhaV-PrlF toxin-antitoxin module